MNNISPITLNIPQELHFLAPVVTNDLIRIGNAKADGGYVIPNSIIKETEVLISFGLNDDWSFDEEFLKLNPAVIIHGYDHTISQRIFFLKTGYAFIKCMIGRGKISNIVKNAKAYLSYKHFFNFKTKHFKERIYNQQVSNRDATIDMVFSRFNSDKVFVKMDIEGGEYRIIKDLLKYSSKILAMVVEFHDTDPLRMIFISLVQEIMEKYEIVHLHANNAGMSSKDSVPELFEITFLRKDFCTQTDCKREILPISNLDVPNKPNKPDYILKFS